MNFQRAKELGLLKREDAAAVADLLDLNPNYVRMVWKGQRRNLRVHEATMQLIEARKRERILAAERFLRAYEEAKQATSVAVQQ